MVGFDSLWKDDFQDDDLLETARAERRLLLTRDRELFERARDLPRHYVSATSPAGQLAETLQATGLTGEALARVRENRLFLSRCLECNILLLPAKPHQVHHLLPGSLLQEHEEFFLCLRCERVYWRGSHYDRMREWIEKTLSPGAS